MKWTWLGSQLCHLVAMGLGAMPTPCEPRFPHLQNQVMALLAPEYHCEDQREIYIIRNNCYEPSSSSFSSTVSLVIQVRSVVSSLCEMEKSLFPNSQRVKHLQGSAWEDLLPTLWPYGPQSSLCQAPGDQPPLFLAGSFPHDLPSEYPSCAILAHCLPSLGWSLSFVRREGKRRGCAGEWSVIFLCLPLPPPHLPN